MENNSLSGANTYAGSEEVTMQCSSYIHVKKGKQFKNDNLYKC